MLWFPATAGVLLLAIGLTRRLFRPASPSVFVIIALLLFHVILLGNVFLLCWALTPLALLTLALIEGAAGAALLIRKPGLGCPAPPPWRALLQNVSWPHALLIALLAIPIIVQIIVGLWIGPRYSDAVEYQLIPPVRWVQEGRIVWGGIGSHPAWTPLERAAGFPKTAAVTAFWHMVFPHDLHPGALAQISWALLGLAAIYVLAREAGVRRVGALGAIAFALFIPEALLQLSEAYVDLSLSAMVMVSALGVWWFWRTPSIPHLILTALALGLMSGIKATGVPFSVIFAGFVLAGMIRARWPAGRMIFGLGLLAGIWLILAGPWYVYNLALWHNPFYPMKFSVLGQMLFDGPIDVDAYYSRLMRTRAAGYWQAVWLVYREDESGIGLAPMWSGLGPHFLILGLPAIAAAVIHHIQTRRRPGPMVFFLVLFGLLYLAQPVKWYARFTLYFAFFAGICFVWLLGRLSRPERYIGAALMIVCLGYSAMKAAPAAASFYFPPDFWHYALKTGDVSPLRLRAWPGEYTARHYIHEHLAGQPATIWIAPNMPILLAMPRGMTPRLVTWDSADVDAWRERLHTEGIDYVYIERTRGLTLWDSLLAEITARPVEFEPVFASRSDGLRRGVTLTQPVMGQYLFRVRPAIAAGVSEAAGAGEGAP